VHYTPLFIVVLVSVALGIRDLASHGWRVAAPPPNLFTGFGVYGIIGILKDAYKLEFPLSLLGVAVAGLVGVLGGGEISYCPDAFGRHSDGWAFRHLDSDGKGLQVAVDLRAEYS
jgi:hypothetical protein